jgi:two-component system cell cycle sensor histidine kinase/response regulator CckA
MYDPASMSIPFLRKNGRGGGAADRPGEPAARPAPEGRHAAGGRGHARGASTPGEGVPEPAELDEMTGIQGFIDAVDALVVVARLECSLWKWNRRCEDTSGIALESVAGKPLWEVMRLPRRFRIEAQSALDALVGGRTSSVEFQAHWLRKDGRRARTRWVARLVSESGTPRYIVATGTESTRASKVARALDETEGRFEKLLAVLPDPVVVHQNGKIVFANRAATDLYRVDDPDHFIGLPVIDRVAPSSRVLVMERMKMMLGEHLDAPLVEERHVRMDGTEFDVEVVAAPVTFNGKPAIELVARDVSTRNEVLAALRDSEARVRAVFDQSALGMALVNGEGRVVESNSAFQKLLGYSAEALASMTVSEYTHPQDEERTATAMAEMFAGRRDYIDMEKRYLASDGHEVWARVHVAPIRDKGGETRHAIATVEDIGEHKTLEEQLRQASKMEALGRLAAGVAHDFNNMLTIVNGYSDLLAQTLEGEQYEDVVKIRDAGAKAKELTGQLLAFARRARPSLQPVDLNRRVRDVAPMLGRLMGEDVAIELEFDDRIRHVEADPGQLDQVIINLAVNARDAMPGGGTLRLATQFLDEVAGREPGTRWARLEISDSGLGMDADVLEHIFEPFFTTKGQEGTGLGLAIVYGIVGQMGGLISVESRLGSGSTFVIELPHVEQPERSDDERARPVRGGTSPATILVVEDEAAVRDLCKRALEADGYQVAACGPGDALRTADELGTRLDLVLTDVVMPELDGPTIAAALRSRRQDLPILFMTGYPRNREEELTGAAARGEVLAKPFTAQELGAAVRRLLPIRQG